MKKTILVISGHPNANSLSNALADAYEASAQQTCTVARLNVRDLSFDMVLRQGYEQPQTLEPHLVDAQRAIQEASHLAWFFPCWWNGPPALVRAFVERVFLPGFAFKYDADHGALPRKLLAGRSARLVTSMDSPSWWHHLVNRRALEVSFARSTLQFCGISPVATKAFYSVRKMEPHDVDMALQQMGVYARADAARP